MSFYLISYDLREPDFEHRPLYTALYAIHAQHIHNSVWGVSTTSSAGVVVHYLWPWLHSKNDRLLVVPFHKTNNYKTRHSLTELKGVHTGDASASDPHLI